MLYPALSRKRINITVEGGIDSSLLQNMIYTLSVTVTSVNRINPNMHEIYS